MDKFPGINAGKKLDEILFKEWNSDLKEFFVALVRRVGESKNPEKEVSKEVEFLDAMGHLLMGNEHCGAIAFSGEDVVIASNLGNQDVASLKQKIICSVGHSSNESQLFLSVCCQLTIGELTQEIRKDIILKLNVEKKQYIPDKEVIVFSFGKEFFDHLKDPINIECTLTSFGHDRILDLLESKGSDFEEPSFVTHLGPLKRRAGKLLRFLSLICNVNLTKKIWTDSPEPQTKRIVDYVTRKFNEFNIKYSLESNDNHAEMFIEFIGFEPFMLFPKENSNVFRYLTKEFFKKMKACEILSQKHNEWLNILNDNLSDELIRKGFYASKDSVTGQEKEIMKELYKNLVDSYIGYCNGRNSSLEMMKMWWATLDTSKIHSTLVDNDKTKPKFLETAQRYFYYLAFIEDFIIEDANNNGILAQRISKFIPSQELENVIVLTGNDDGIHAELRLLDYHYLHKKLETDYFGIGKLCCSLCSYTFGQLGFHSRGSHHILMKWPVPQFLSDGNNGVQMKKFLGDDLYQKYVKISEQGKRDILQNGKLYSLKEVCIALIKDLYLCTSANKIKEELSQFDLQFGKRQSTTQFPKLEFNDNNTNNTNNNTNTIVLYNTNNTNNNTNTNGINNTNNTNNTSNNISYASTKKERK